MQKLISKLEEHRTELCSDRSRLIEKWLNSDQPETTLYSKLIAIKVEQITLVDRMIEQEEQAILVRLFS